MNKIHEQIIATKLVEVILKEDGLSIFSLDFDNLIEKEVKINTVIKKLLEDGLSPLAVIDKDFENHPVFMLERIWASLDDNMKMHFIKSINQEELALLDIKYKKYLLTTLTFETTESIAMEAADLFYKNGFIVEQGTRLNSFEVQNTLNGNHMVLRILAKYQKDSFDFNKEYFDGSSHFTLKSVLEEDLANTYAENSKNQIKKTLQILNEIIIEKNYNSLNESLAKNNDIKKDKIKI